MRTPPMPVAVQPVGNMRAGQIADAAADNRTDRSSDERSGKRAHDAVPKPFLGDSGIAGGHQDAPYDEK